MIYDSGIWKSEIRNKINEFKDLIKKTSFSQEWLFEDDENGLTESYKFFIEFQKFCFYSSVISRKFIESNRLSDELLSKKYLIKSFKKKSKKILTKENVEFVDDEYNLEKVYKTELSIEKICHIFIHSFIFNPKLNEYKIDINLLDEDIENYKIEGISGLYINTDFTKEKLIYYFDVEQIFRIFEEVVCDNIVYIYKNDMTGKVIRSNSNQNKIF